MADLAVVLVDARKGLLPQSRRHAYIASLLGLSHIVVAINKMDLIDYDERVFARIESDFRRFLSQFKSIEPYFIPVSALKGDNVVSRSGNMRWYHGPSLLEYLERVPTGNRIQQAPFRFPVQRVLRSEKEVRGYAGTIASGHIAPGDPVIILPSGRNTSVREIVTFDGNLDSAFAGQSVTLMLRDEVDVIRGDMIVAPDDTPSISSSIEAILVWLNDVPAQANRRYRLKHTCRQEWAELKHFNHRINVNTLNHEPTEALEMNALGLVQIETAKPLTFDTYSKNRATGSFILIDPATNATVAAGMISRAESGRNIVGASGAQVSWRFENSSLLLSGIEAAGAEAKSSIIEDREALDALNHLLQRLGLSISDTKPGMK